MAVSLALTIATILDPNNSSTYTWDDGHNDHVEHVVQQEGDGDGDEDELALVLGLLEGIPPLLPHVTQRLLEEGQVHLVQPHPGEGLTRLKQEGRD